MNYEDKIRQVLENSNTRRKLIKAGIYPNQTIGPTGPAGKELEIMGSYDSLEEFQEYNQPYFEKILTSQSEEVRHLS